MNACGNARSMCRPHVELAMHVRTDVRTNAEAWLSTREIPTFRNARTHIRIFPSANFHTYCIDAEEART